MVLGVAGTGEKCHTHTKPSAGITSTGKNQGKSHPFMSCPVTYLFAL